MRIDRLRIDAFGGLEDFDTGEEALGDLSVFVGRNEAGKSTFFEWVATLLYGFSPASRESHPYTPWGGRTAEGSGLIRDSNGGSHEVRRRLMSSPSGSLTRDGQVEDLRNRALPFVDHVPANVFRQVFALRLSELASLEGAGWDAVQDRLLGAFGASDLRSAREVAGTLEAEAGRLWRPNRKGRQEIRELDDRKIELRMRRSEAMREERLIRDATDSLARAAARLEIARQERMDARAFVERYRALLPIREQLLRIAGLREDAGETDVLDRLPSGPAEQLDALQRSVREAERRLQTLQQERERPEAAIAEYDLHTKSVIARDSEIQNFLRSASVAERTRLRRAQLEQDRRDIRRRIEAGTVAALGVTYTDDLVGPLAGLPVNRLRDAVDRYERASVPRPEEAGAVDLEFEEPTAGNPQVGPGLALGGLVLLVLSTFMPGTLYLAVLGALIAGVGIARISFDRNTISGRQKAAGAAEARRRAAIKARGEREAVRTAAADECVDLLRELVPEFKIEQLSPGLPGELIRFQEWIRDDWDRREDLERLTAELGALEQAAADLSSLDPSLAMDAAGLAHDLPGLVSRATQRREAALSAERELARLDLLIAEAKADHGSATTALEALSSTLIELGGGDRDHGLAEAEVRLRARDRANQLMDELELAHPHLDEITVRIAEAEEAGEDWAVDPEAIARHRALEETLSDEIEALQGQTRSIEKEIEHLHGRVLVDDLDGEERDLDDARERLVRRRDRLWIMARVVRDAERILREEHQPALLRRAGEFLKRLTNGRYDRLLIGGRDGRGFLVRGSATPEPLPVEHPLSTGTREQIYLALRLAILDHLDRSGERLPVILDEVLVNWDSDRQGAGIELIAEIAKERQVMFFTCHPEVADQLTATGARRFDL